MLLESQKAELQKKVTALVRFKLRAYLSGQGAKKHRGTEIARLYGLASNRQSELTNPAKYPDARVSWNDLRELIGRGFITLKEIEEGVTLDDEEREYLNSELRVHGDQELHGELMAMLKEGYTIKDIVGQLKKRKDE